MGYGSGLVVLYFEIYTTGQCLKITGETPEVLSDKRKPREERKEREDTEEIEKQKK